MTHRMPRRGFLAGAATAAASAALADLGFPRPLLGAEKEAPDDFPRQGPDATRTVVGASHGQFERVMEMVEARPALAKASWDWGFGDWESALGAAAHVGRADIARFLMEHGARPNVFTFAMLGKVDAVEAMVAAQPGLQRVHGPHGIPLLAHVRTRLGRDGLSAAERDGLEQTRAYLEEVGGADEGQLSLEVPTDARPTYLGRYRYGPGEAETVEVVVLQNMDMLAIDPAGAGPRVLHRVEAHGFAPTGAPAVRVRFEVEDGVARALTIHDPAPVVRAEREG